MKLENPKLGRISPAAITSKFLTGLNFERMGDMEELASLAARKYLLC